MWEPRQLVHWSRLGITGAAAAVRGCDRERFCGSGSAGAGWALVWISPGLAEFVTGLGRVLEHHGFFLGGGELCEQVNGDSDLVCVHLGLHAVCAHV